MVQGLSESDLILLKAVVKYMRNPPEPNRILTMFGGMKCYVIDHIELANMLPEQGWTAFDIEIRLKRLVNMGIFTYAQTGGTNRACYKLTDEGIDAVIGMEDE